jgi:hypothetical protein
MGVARNGRGAAVAVVTVGLVQSIAFPSIAHAGFFDFLFGQLFQSPAVRPFEGDFGGMPGRWGADWGFRRRADPGFHRHGHKLSTRRKMVVADSHPTGPLAPTDLMDDESLRPGDAVMTPTGIRIFVGRPAATMSRTISEKYLKSRGFPNVNARPSPLLTPKVPARTASPPWRPDARQANANSFLGKPS